MAFPLDKSKYIEVGAKKGLDFVDTTPPATVYDKCNWVCKVCGLKYYKTYRAVYLGAHGCRCQNGMSLPRETYAKIEKTFGIILVSKKPNNYTTPVDWYSTRTKERVSLSYNDIKRMSKKAVFGLERLGVKRTGKHTFEMFTTLVVPEQEEVYG